MADNSSGSVSDQVRPLTFRNDSCSARPVNAFHHLLVRPFQQPYMWRALVELLILGVAGGSVGVHVLLRRNAFMTDALHHTVFPGIAIAFVVHQSLLLGALASGALSVVLLGMATRRRRLDHDAVLALLIATSFALGVVVVSRRRTYQNDLTALLFGRLLAVDGQEIAQTALVVAVALGALALLHKELVFAAFDRFGAAALGLRTGLLDAVVNVVVMLCVVAAIRAVGTILVIAYIVTPAATARLACHRLLPMMVCAGVLAAFGGYAGLVVSYAASVDHGVRLAPGATVVAILTLATVVVATTRAVGGRARRRIRNAPVR